MIRVIQPTIGESIYDGAAGSAGFVLGHYVQRGVRELDQDKLPRLIELTYHAVGDAVAELGSVANIREVFVGFQQHLY